MSWEILAPLAKWGAMSGVLIFGIWAFAKHFKKDGVREERYDQLEKSGYAQVRESKVSRNQRTRDLLDDLKRVRKLALQRESGTLYNEERAEAIRRHSRGED